MKLNLATLKFGTLAALVITGSLPAFAQATNRANPRDFKAFGLITDRNIFDVNRRPVVRFPPRTNIVVYSFSLVGTMNYEKGLYAVFDGTSEDYHKVLESGGRIATYTVSDITHDSCKLTHGTNEIELKVGMQMRRNTDGSWTAAQQTGETSYASSSNSRFGNGNRSSRFDRNDRNDRGSRFGNGFSGRNNSRNGERSYGNAGNEFSMGGPPDGGGMEAGGAPPANAGSSDPNDVVARLMAARAAQLGQSPGQGQSEGDNQPPDQNVQGGNPNENQTGNQNVPNQNQPNENQGGPPTGNENISNPNQNANDPGTPRT